MSTTWIVTANASRARFFSRENAADRLDEVDDLVNEATRLRTVDTETDDLGQRSAGKSRHGSGAASQPSGYEPHQTPAEHQTELFARSVAAHLSKGLQAGRFGSLYLAASPEFLGVLRKQLDPKVTAIVGKEINKDYTQSNARQLQDQIAAHELKE